MNKKILFLLILVLTFASFQMSASCASYGYNEYMGNDEIPYGGSAELSYGYTNFTMYDEAGAKEAGIPEGYSGYVLKSDGGFSVDLSKYLAADISEIKFRVYCQAGTTSSELRMTIDGGSNWKMRRYMAEDEFGKWIEVSYTDIAGITDSTGYLKQFCFTWRHFTNATIYIDSITVVKNSYGYDEYMGTDEIPYGGDARPIYQYTEFIMYNETGAAAASVPEGYSGYVLKTDGGFSVDMSHLLGCDVKNIKFRVYMTGTVGTTEFRMTTDGGSNWHMRYYPTADELGAWTEVVYTDIESITDDEGYLVPFFIAPRRHSGTYIYVDSITAEMAVAGTDEIPVGGNAAGYTYDEYVMYEDGVGAEEAGVPAGYTGDVLAISRSAYSSVGVPINMTTLDASRIKEIKFRLYCPDNSATVRLTVDGGTTWLMQETVPATGEWVEVSLSSASKLASMAKDNGKVKLYNFGVRFNNMNGGTVYIDSVTAVMKNSSLPTITIEGESYTSATGARTPTGSDTAVLNAGSAVVAASTSAQPTLTYKATAPVAGVYEFKALMNVLAEGDSFSEWELSVGENTYQINASTVSQSAKSYINEYDFHKTILTGGIELARGENTITLKALPYSGSSYSGAIDYIDLIYSGEDDTDAPVIEFTSDAIYVPVGTWSRYEAIVTDACAGVETSYEWSEGAVDRRSRLLEGTHTLTVTAIDPFGNSSQNSVTFNVTKYDVTLTENSISIRNALDECQLFVVCYNADQTEVVGVRMIDGVVNNVEYNITEIPEETELMKAFVWDNYSPIAVQKLQL